MNKVSKQLWIEALRSGQFKQGRYGMKPTKDTYCCLAVLREVTGKSPWDNENRLSCYGALIKMNDDEGESFAEIADWIEANVDGAE